MPRLKKALFLFTIACIVIAVLDSCHSRKKAAARAAHRHQTTKGKTARPAPPTRAAQLQRKASDPAVLKQKYAKMLGVPPAKITNLTLYRFIDRWYGTHYRSGGCDANGIDCSGFVQKLYSEVYGVDLVRTAMDQFRKCRFIKKPSDAVEGDLVFFSIRTKNISHVGIYLANNRFVHASTSGGVMISNLQEEYWSRYYVSCGRVPKG